MIKYSNVEEQVSDYGLLSQAESLKLEIMESKTEKEKEATSIQTIVLLGSPQINSNADFKSAASKSMQNIKKADS